MALSFISREIEKEETISPAVKLFSLIVLSTIINSLQLKYNILFSLSIIAFSYLILRFPLFSFLYKWKEMVIFIVLVSVAESYFKKDLMILSYQFFKLTNLLSLSILFINSTSVISLSSALSSLFKPVVGKKANRISSSITLTFSLIPIVFSLSYSLFLSFKARSSTLKYHPIKTLSLFLETLLIRTLEKATNYIDALESRFYDADAERSSNKIKKKDIVIFVCVLLILILHFLVKLN